MNQDPGTSPSPVAPSAGEPAVLDDARWEPGMPVLDRQPVRETRPASALPPSLQGLPPRSVPETRPTSLQPYYVYLSVVVFVCGLVAITALELGAPIGSPLVKLCVLVGAPLLILTTLDAVLRIWRSAWAWMPVDRGRGLFRLAWLVPALVLITLAAGALVVVLPA